MRNVASLLIGVAIGIIVCLLISSLASAAVVPPVHYGDIVRVLNPTAREEFYRCSNSPQTVSAVSVSVLELYEVECTYINPSTGEGGQLTELHRRPEFQVIKYFK